MIFLFVGVVVVVVLGIARDSISLSTHRGLVTNGSLVFFYAKGRISPVSFLGLFYYSTAPCNFG